MHRIVSVKRVLRRRRAGARRRGGAACCSSPDRSAAPVAVGLVQGSTVSLSWAPGAGTVAPVHLPARGRQRQRRGESARRSRAVARTRDLRRAQWPLLRAGAHRDRGGVSAPSNEISLRVGCVAAPAPPVGLAVQVAGNNVSRRLAAAVWRHRLRARSRLRPGAANLAVVPLGGPGIARRSAQRHLLRARPGGELVRHERAVGGSRVHHAGEHPSRRRRRSSPPPPGTPFWPAALDPAILGTCSAAVHDRYADAGGDGYWYRTWHRAGRSRPAASSPTSTATTRAPPAATRSAPRSPLAGAVRLHRAPDADAGRAQRARGAARRLQGVRRQPRRRQRRGPRQPRLLACRCSTWAPADRRGSACRTTPRTSALVHPEFGLKAFTQLMMNTGGTGAVCDPRVQGADQGRRASSTRRAG